MTRNAAFFVLALSASLMASEARADQVCSGLLAPSSTSLRDTGFDQPRAACGANDFSAGTRAFALLDTDNFYGTLSGSLFLNWRTMTELGFEFGIGARVLDYRFAQLAVFSGTQTSLGPVQLSIAHPRSYSLLGRPLILTEAFRVDVPWSNSSDESFGLTASPSLTATWVLGDSLQLHNRAAVLLWSIIAKSGPDARTAGVLSSDLGYQVAAPVSLLLGAEVQTGWYGLGLDHVEVRSGMRVGGATHAVELSVGAVVAGAERADLVVWLGYRHRREQKKEEKHQRSRLSDWAHKSTTPKPKAPTPAPEPDPIPPVEVLQDECPPDLESLVGQQITLVGTQTRTKVPTVCNVDVDGDYLLSDLRVQASGVLERFEILPAVPGEPIRATRGPGVYFRLLDVDGRIASTRAVQ